MKFVVSFNSKEQSAINDVLGSFGSELRTAEFTKSGKFGATAKGVYNPFGGFVGIVEIPDWLVLGTSQVLMSNKKAIKGLFKAIDGICEMTEGLIRSLRQDFAKMIEDHHNK